MDERTNVIVEEAPAQVFLQPVAPPSILGLFGLAGATMMLSTYILGWYGSPDSQLFLFPFVALFGGIAQFAAALWSFRARDGLAVAVHGLWGSFWIAFGILHLLYATGSLTSSTSGFSQEIGMWFVVAAMITWICAWAAGANSFVLLGTLLFLAAGSTTGAIAHLSASTGWLSLAGWLLFIAAILAWYTASASLLESAYGRVILPLGKVRHAERAPKVALGFGEPGVTHGQ